MEKENLFIYKITTNRDWFLLSWSFRFQELMINSYEALKWEIIKDLDEFPSEEDFEVYKSSVSTKEKFIHYIISWYCVYGCGLLLMDDNDEVYFIIDEKLDNEELQLLNEIETDAFLNDLITEFGLEKAFNKTQAYYLEHNDEIIESLKELECYYDELGFPQLYKEDERYGETFKRIKEEEFNNILQ